MRICVVTHYMPPHAGGVERVAADLVAAYTEAGHHVTWVATATPEAPARTGSGSIATLRVRAWNGLERRASIPYPVPTPGALLAISRAAASSDIVHAHDCLYATSVAAAIGASRAQRPLLLTQHVGFVRFGAAANALQLLAYRTLGARVLASAAHVAFVNASVAAWFERIGVRPKRCSVIANGVDTEVCRPPAPGERERARAALGLPDVPIALFVGRLVPKKNVRLAAEVAAHAGLTLVAIGDGPERDALRGRGGVVHVPSLPHARIPDAYRAADVFLLPSRGEGMPLALLEALASGLPCVVSGDPAFDDVASAGVVERGADAHALVEATRRAYGARRDELVRGSRAWALVHGDRRVTARRYVELLSELA